MKPELFLMGSMNKENNYGKLILYMVTAARSLCVKSWKSNKTQLKIAL